MQTDTAQILVNYHVAIAKGDAVRLTAELDGSNPRLEPDPNASAPTIAQRKHSVNWLADRAYGPAPADA